MSKRAAIIFVRGIGRAEELGMFAVSQVWNDNWMPESSEASVDRAIADVESNYGDFLEAARVGGLSFQLDVDGHVNTWAEYCDIFDLLDGTEYHELDEKVKPYKAGICPHCDSDLSDVGVTIVCEAKTTSTMYRDAGDDGVIRIREYDLDHDDIDVREVTEVTCGNCGGYLEEDVVEVD